MTKIFPKKKTMQVFIFFLLIKIVVRTVIIATPENSWLIRNLAII